MAVSFVFVTVLVVIHVIKCLQPEKCAVMDFYHLDKNVLSIFEDRFVNVTFGMSVSPECHQLNQTYRVTVNTRTKSDSLEYDGTIIFWKNMCTYTYQTSTRCITPAGPAELYRKVNRSHVQIEWTWRDKDFRFGNFTSMRKDLMLSVTSPPYVTRLTVDGEDVGSNHFINENQKVTISCLFDKGSPPQDFFLLDENRNKMNALRDELHLNYSLTLGCKKNWQTIQCAGNNSVKNRSVLLFVKCALGFFCHLPSFNYKVEFPLGRRAFLIAIQKVEQPERFCSFFVSFSLEGLYPRANASYEFFWTFNADNVCFLTITGFVIMEVDDLADLCTKFIAIIRKVTTVTGSSRSRI